MGIIGEVLVAVVILVGGGLFVLDTLMEWTVGGRVFDIFRHPLGARFLKYFVLGLAGFAVAAVLISG
jgi:hypothetical protein